MLKVFLRSGFMLLSLFLMAASNAGAQEFQFRTHAGKKQVHSWKDSSSVTKQNQKSSRFGSDAGKSPYAWALLSKPLSNQLKNSLDSLHVSILGTTGKEGNCFAYKLKIRNNQDAVIDLLKQNNSFVNTVTEDAEDKITSELLSVMSKKSPDDTLKYWVMFNSDLSKDSINELCQQYADSIIYDNNKFPKKFILIVSKISSINLIASLEEVNALNVYSAPKPTLYGTRQLLGIDAIQQSTMNLQEPVFDSWIAGKNYTGEGVTVANGEDNGGYKHVGLCEINSQGETVVRNESSPPTKFSDYWGYSDHGLHTAGIIGGNGWGSKLSPKNSAGILNYYRGIAPKVKFTSYPYADINNHSFASDGPYYSNDPYGAVSQDEQSSCHADTFDNYNNVMVVAAANNGIDTQYYNQMGYYSLNQNAKNSIVVGATGNSEMKKADFSSMGPTRDGRIKPDVMAPGTGTLGFTQYSVDIDSISIINNGVKKTWDFNDGNKTFSDGMNDVISTNVSGGIYSFTTGPGSDCFMFSQPLVPQIISSVNDTLVLRMKATPANAAIDSMTIGIMLKRPSDSYIKMTTVSKVVHSISSWQIIYIPLTGDQLVTFDNGGWVDGDTIEKIRLDFSCPTHGLMSLGTHDPLSSYVYESGTSMASPVVAGVAALMMQQYGTYLKTQNTRNGTNYTIHKNPMWNSTVRGIIIHTATDMVDLTGASNQVPNPDFLANGYSVTDIYTQGPDWATGWGMVNPVKALEYTNPKVRFFESSIDVGQLKTYNFTVPSSSSPSNARITLCWDDPAKGGTNDKSTAFEKKLVNDLDVYVKNVATGQIIRPWTLYQTAAMHGNADTLPANGIDPITPDMIRNNPAVRGIDTLNNVEVIDIANPASGVWQIVVSGKSIPMDQSTESGINQDFSLIFDITPDISTPYNLTATAVSKSQINLSWKDKTTGTTSGFYIERATGTGAFAQIANVGSTVTSYNNTGLTQNVRYRYRVRANTSTGYSDYSNIDSTTTYTNVAQGMTVTVSSTQTGNTGAKAVDGNSTSTRWAAVSSAMPQWLTVDLGGLVPVSGCEIVFEKAGTSGDCNDFKIETSPDNATWTSQVNLPSNTNTAQTQSCSFTATTRYVRITITDAPGTNWASIYEFRVFGSSCPSQVTGLTLTQVTDCQFKLSWSAAYKATSYTVKSSTTPGGPYYTIASGLTATSFTTTDLQAGTDYYFIVVAMNVSGASVNSAEVGSMSNSTIPNAPTSLVVIPNKVSGFTLSWKDNSNCENWFQIERRVYGTTTWEMIGISSANQTSYEDVNVQDVTAYEYRVSAANRVGLSATTSIVPTLPAVPTSLSTSPYRLKNQVLLTWKCDGSSQTGYVVEVSTDYITFSQLSTVPDLGTLITGLTLNMTYYYRVYSFNNAGKSGYSEIAYYTPYDPCYGYQGGGRGLTGTVFGLDPEYASGSEYCKATDGDSSTYYDYEADGACTGLDFGTAKRINTIRYYPRSGFASRMVGGKFQGSNTSSTTGFVDLHTISTTPAMQWTTAWLSSTTAYRWVRYLGPEGSNGNIAEMEFYSGITYEAESSTPSASSVGYNVSSGDANNSNSAFVQLSGTPAVGAWLQFTLANVPAGTFNVTVYFKANYNRGIFQGSVDGTNLGGTGDEYSASTVYQKSFSMGSKTFTAGNHTIKFAVTGKNASSSAYALTIDKIVLTQ
jgi:hypothetical protein